MPGAAVIATQLQPADAAVGTRSFVVYEGEDLSPVYDYTDDLRWNEAEFGGRAYQGEATSSSAVIRDPDGLHGGTKGLYSRNVAAWLQGSNVMWRGRVGAKDYSRGPQAVNRYREAGTYLEDYNVDLRGIPVIGWVRPTETDQARAQALGQFLNHNPRATTALDLARYVSGSNLVTLAAKTYTQTDVSGVLSEIASEANKTFFVTVDGELFYDGNDSTAYRCPFRISDREDEVRASSHVFAPIWDSGSAVTEDGQQLLSGLYLYYGGESYVYVADASIAAQYGFYEETVYDDTATSANATTRAAAILARRKNEDRTVNVTIGPLTDAHTGSIKWGQIIAIKARAIPDADDAYVDRRIVQLKWTTPVPGTFFAHMQLGRPEKIVGYGVGDKALTVSVHGPIDEATDFADGTLPQGTLIVAGDDSVVFDGDRVQLAQTEGTLPIGVAFGIPQTAVTAAGVVASGGGASAILGDIGGGLYGLKVTNSGSVVIIDGTSNMFKIAATGTQSMAGPVSPAQSSVSVDLATGFTYVPTHHGFFEWGDGERYSLNFFVGSFLSGSAEPIDYHWQTTQVVDTNETRVTVRWASQSNRSAFTGNYRYYVMKEVAI